ncbi:hypothetical protein GGX14DRAFT_473753 [Mycena pura]|uniref:BTB domain-containing protein n=1 Tax=Mycena pura TaxID=153505 RepID=A0AAD6V054_9AGAR|nr:hypothetical protein GGX14DRAFT_473753 [Mycena pura]
MDGDISRPAKRPRSDSGADESQLPARDSAFYHESGDCIIRVENTLFKIHRFLLVPASAVFSTLFTLPQGDLAVEGMSDDAPICLSDDTAADFRCLLKYIYTPAYGMLPKDIPPTELHNIMSVARLMHKYEMAGWQTWASQVTMELVTTHGPLFSSQDFVAIYEMAHMFSHEQLSKKVTNVWWRRIRDGSLPISDALNAAEANNRRAFLTSLYDYELGKVLGTPVTPFQPTQLFIPGVKAIHLQRLYAGYCSLSLAWTQFRQNIIPLPTAPGCRPRQHDLICNRKFKTAWDRAIAFAEQIPLNKPRERIVRVHRALEAAIEGDEYPVHHPVAVLHPQQTICRYVHSNEPTNPFVKLLNDLSKTLEGHFFAADAPAPVNHE